MKIGIANDHRGYETKQKLTKYLIDLGYNVINYGTDSQDRADYTKYGFLLGENKKATRHDNNFHINRVNVSTNKDMLHFVARLLLPY